MHFAGVRIPNVVAHFTRVNGGPGFTAIHGTIQPVTVRRIILRPGLCAPNAAGSCNQSIGIVRLRHAGTEAIAARRNIGYSLIGRIVAVDAAAGSVKGQAANVAEQEVSVCIHIDSGRVGICWQIFAEYGEIIGSNVCYDHVAFCLYGSTDINFTALNMNSGYTILRAIFRSSCGTNHMLGPGWPFQGVLKESQVIVTLYRAPGLAAVFTHNQAGITSGNIAAAVEDIRVIGVNCNGFAALSAVAVCVYLNQVGYINPGEGFAAVCCLEDFGAGIAEVCAACQQIEGVVVSRVDTECIDTEHATIFFIQECHQLFPALGFIVVLVCTANVGTCQHDFLSGDDTGNEPAAANFNRAPIHLVLDGI